MGQHHDRVFIKVNWENALSTTVGEQDEPYGYGDCCAFVARYWQLLTGDDVATQFNYASTRDALSVMAEYGGIIGVISEAIGKPTEAASPGDVVVVECKDPAGEAVQSAGVLSNGFAVCRHPDHGIWRVTSNAVIAAWEVPCRKP